MSTITIKSGDTLSALAAKYHTTVSALAKANGISNPDRIYAGRRLTIPDGFGTSQPKAAAQKPVGHSGTSTYATGAGNSTGSPPKSGGADGTLGALSRKYEATGPGTVSSGKGDAGGVSYGSYQFSSKTGSAQEFVNSLKATHPDYYAALSGSKPGSASFSKAWKDLAKKDPTGFDRAQHDFIKTKFYDPAASKVAKMGLDVNGRSHALKDVLWSTAVQHGPGGAAGIIKAALHGRDPATVSDAQLIKDIYAERGRKSSSGGLVHFSSCSSAVQASVANRFKNELRDALAELQKGG